VDGIDDVKNDGVVLVCCVGFKVGWIEGIFDSLLLGFRVGCIEGTVVNNEDGSTDGSLLGETLGSNDGDEDIVGALDETLHIDPKSAHIPWLSV